MTYRAMKMVSVTDGKEFTDKDELLDYIAASLSTQQIKDVIDELYPKVYIGDCVFMPSEVVRRHDCIEAFRQKAGVYVLESCRDYIGFNPECYTNGQVLDFGGIKAEVVVADITKEVTEFVEDIITDYSGEVTARDVMNIIAEAYCLRR